MNFLLPSLRAHQRHTNSRRISGKTVGSGISNEKLADLVIALHDEDRLCQHGDHDEVREPVLICSLGLAPAPPV